jgi:hypothetical protein
VRAAGAIVVLSLAMTPFMPEARPKPTGRIEVWKRLLAAFQGGITEELLRRLFLLSAVAWLIWQFAFQAPIPPPAAHFWIATIVAAILFGVALLPAAAAVWPLTFAGVLRAILLNMLPGVPLGLIFWRCGLENAMPAHFCASIVLQLSGGVLQCS